MPNLKCADSLLFLLAKRTRDSCDRPRGLERSVSGIFGVAKRTWGLYGGLRRQRSADSLLFLLAKRTRGSCGRLRGLERSVSGIFVVAKRTWGLYGGLRRQRRTLGGFMQVCGREKKSTRLNHFGCVLLTITLLLTTKLTDLEIKQRVCQNEKRIE